MKNILILIDQDVITRNLACQWIQKVEKNLPKQEVSHTKNPYILVKVLTVTSVNSKYEKVLEVQYTTGWLTVEETTATLNLDPPENADEGLNVSGSRKVDDLATNLHEAADSLPYLESDLHILLFMRLLKESISPNSFVSVAGALRRLVVWHNGHIAVIKQGQELTPQADQLTEFAHCRVVDCIDEVEIPCHSWTGRVSIKDCMENISHTFYGLSLEAENWDQKLQQKLQNKGRQTHESSKKKLRGKTSTEQSVALSSIRIVCGKTLEILQEVDLRTFPLYLLDTWKLELSANLFHSKSLITYIQDQLQTGLLARLQIYPDCTKIPVCGNTSNRSTAAWKEQIIADYQYLKESEENLAEDAEYLYLLLLPNTKNLSMPQRIQARVLLSPHQFNREVFQILEDQIKAQRYSSRQRSREEERMQIDSANILLLEKREKFSLMLDLLLENQRHSNQNYQGQVETSELATSAVDTQSDIISAIFKDSISLKEYLETNSDCPQHNIQWISEASLDLSKFPDKLVLDATDEQRKSLLSFPSVDSLSAVSPMSLAELEKKKNSIDFDVADVLQLFNRDGSHITLPVSPVKLKGRSLCRVESQPDLNVSWPHSQLLQYHDVYYYNGENDWLLEKKYSKLRDKGYFQDTRSSFVSPIKSKPQLKRISPVRCSPRKSASSQHLMTRCRSDSLHSHANGWAPWYRRNEAMYQSPRYRRQRGYVPGRPIQKSRLCTDPSTFTKITRACKSSPVENLFKQPAARSRSPQRRSSLNTSISTPELSLIGTSSQRRHSSESRDQSLHSSQSNRVLSKRLSLNSQNVSKHSDSLSKRHSQSVTSHSKAESDFTVWGQKKPSSLLTAVRSDTPVRRSPRKSKGITGGKLQSQVADIPDSEEKDTPNSDVKEIPSSQCNDTSNSSQGAQGSKEPVKMKRSDRHKMKLRRIIDHVLQEKGVKPGDTIHAACSRNLFNVSLVLLKTLPTSQNLTEEMKTVVYGQVTQIINLEKRRCGIAL